MKWDRTAPCASCPYRKDAPIGLWHRSEFENLVAQDANEYGGALFGCHEFRKKPRSEHRPCAGWLLDQKRRHVPSIQLRLVLITNESARRCFEAVAPPKGVRLYGTIAEMCAANIRRRRRRTG
jgi:hypothetical protein